jgi:ABC-type glycerol-3-phosphate transport system permease component
VSGRPRGARGLGFALWIHGAAALLALFCGFPLLWMLLTSLKPDAEILTAEPVLWPSRLQFDAYLRLFFETSFAIYFWNSIKVAGIATLLTILVATLAAYAVTRFRFPGRELVAGTMLFTYMFAPIMIVVPFYIMVRSVGLMNTHAGLVLSYTAFSLPFSMWLLRSFFRSIPLELEEAAMIDGASRPQAVARIVVPLALPGVIAVSIFTFIVAWNDYLFARVLISADRLKTLPVGMNDLYNATVTDWGMMMAAGVVITIPALVFFVLVQRWLIAGWGAGGVKG